MASCITGSWLNQLRFLSGDNYTRQKGTIRHWTRVTRLAQYMVYVLAFAVALSGLTAPSDNYTRPKGMYDKTLDIGQKAHD